MRFGARSIHDTLYLHFEARCIYNALCIRFGGHCINNVIDLHDAFTCTVDVYVTLCVVFTMYAFWDVSHCYTMYVFGPAYFSTIKPVLINKVLLPFLDSKA